ncbi:apoptosis regulator BAX isoform X4 [Falco naumanni]|uniref:apoptosis regulator BAX isoform X4 n=1 Tax=Falco naumanni TaxID=148594 RepID=UPI001ADE2323|nr:apoptosis regulator BAX isoform X4 [Falco naumanni]
MGDRFVLSLLEQERGLPRQVPPEELGGEGGDATPPRGLAEGSRPPGLGAPQPGPRAEQALWGDHPLRTILDWAVSFLQRHLSTWIQHQGGWGSILSYSPPQPSQNPCAGGALRSKG